MCVYIYIYITTTTTTTTTSTSTSTSTTTTTTNDNNNKLIILFMNYGQTTGTRALNLSKSTFKETFPIVVLQTSTRRTFPGYGSWWSVTCSLVPSQPPNMALNVHICVCTSAAAPCRGGFCFLLFFLMPLTACLFSVPTPCGLDGRLKSAESVRSDKLPADR